MAFATCARALGGIYQLVHADSAGFPLKLFTLLHGGRAAAEAVLATPKCQLDTFSRRFLERYSSPEKLTSADCQAVLRLVAMEARTDISHIECRHASLRRIIRVRAQTHAPPFRRTSASWVAMRQRVLERGLWQCRRTGPQAGAGDVKVRTRRKKKKAVMRGGGGTMRAFLSAELKRAHDQSVTGNAADKSGLLKFAHAAYRRMVAQQGPELARLRQIGSIQTAQHRIRRRSGSPKKRKRQLEAGAEALVQSMSCRELAVVAAGGSAEALDRRLALVHKRRREEHAKVQAQAQMEMEALQGWSETRVHALVFPV